MNWQEIDKKMLTRAKFLESQYGTPRDKAVQQSRAEIRTMLALQTYGEIYNNPKFSVGYQPKSSPEAKEPVMFGNNQLYAQVDNATWDLLTGKVGYKDGNSVVTLNEKRITRNPILGGALPSLPGFALPTKAEQISVGDLVLNGETIIGFITEKKEGGLFETIDFNGRVGTWSAPEGILFGDTKVIRSLTSMLGGDTAGIQSMLMPFLLMGKDVTNLLPVLLMSKMGVPGTDVKGFDSNMLTMMLAMQSLTGFRK